MLSPFQSQTRKNTAHICCICAQKGLRRIPVPNGEKGFTFAHIRASFSEMADLPSSKKNAGPYEAKKRISKFSDICLILIYKQPTCILRPVKQEIWTSEWLGKFEPVTQSGPSRPLMSSSLVRLNSWLYSLFWASDAGQYGKVSGILCMCRETQRLNPAFYDTIA